jgi:hypothetical protein
MMIRDLHDAARVGDLCCVTRQYECQKEVVPAEDALHACGQGGEPLSVTSSDTEANRPSLLQNAGASHLWPTLYYVRPKADDIWSFGSGWTWFPAGIAQVTQHFQCYSTLLGPSPQA